MKTALLALSIVWSAHAFGQVQYRPHITCVAPNGSAQVDVARNLNDKDVQHAFQISVVKRVDDKIMNYEKINAQRVPIRHRDVLDFFEGKSDVQDYRFDLTITRMKTQDGYQADLIDTHGTRVLICNYLTPSSK